MSVATAANARAPARSLTIAILLALGLVAAWFIVTRALVYANYSVSAYGPYFWPRRWGLVPHIVGGLTAVTTGLVQLWLGLTNRVAGLHRALGKVYLAGVVVGSVGGYYLSLTIPAHEVAYAAGLFMLSTVWLLTTGVALFAIRRRNLIQHREWMLRSYTVTFAFVTFRLAADVLVRLHFASHDDISTIMAWACWAVPLIVIEALIQARKIGPAKARGLGSAQP